jgi:hypothetical protein
MLVCGLFNASIHAECFKDTHQFDSASQSWKPLDPNNQSIAVNSHVSFRVTELHTSSGIIAMQGIPSTESNENTQSGYHNKQEDQEEQQKKKSGKKRSRESETATEQQDDMTTPKQDKHTKKEKKHSKSHKKKKSKVKE